jgi:hypothetical protein
MSLDYLDQQMEAVRARATGLQRNLAAQRKSIEADTRLSPEGKKEQVLAMAADARAAMAKLRAEEDKLVTDKLASLERTVMGSVGSLPSDVISYRDAQDRAERIESSDEASRLMARALRSGDKTLASAIAHKALDSGYREAYNAFAAENPANAEAAKDLAALRKHLDSLNSSFERTMTYSTTLI